MAEKQSLGTMISGLTEDLSGLVRGEIELVKAEARETMQNVGKGGGMLAAAGVTAFLALVFLLLTLAWVLVQLGLQIWAGFGIVTLLLIIVATILGVAGKKTLDEAQSGGQMTRTQASIEETKAVLTRRPAAAAAEVLADVPATAGAALPATAPNRLDGPA